jgi:UDP-GlcNAc:undecaprenyl-phosphate GlcNAc-1-phosphate transferase
MRRGRCTVLPIEAAGISFGLGAVAALAAVPAAIRVAHLTGFLDRPAGYKKHGQPTPYLGGSAVLIAFVVAAVAFGDVAGRFLPLILGALVLWVVGTIDDRVNLSPWLRIGVTVATAAGLWAGDLGWNVFPGAMPDLLLTILWVLGLVNAFNLMDNLDGASTTVAATGSVGVGAFALVNGDVALAGVSLALAGACIGFLRFNLARPARIFLGDGGSMPIGFIVAALAIAAQPVDELGRGAILSAALLVGLVILDTTLVIVSRRRRGVQLLTGGRDHLTHRMLGAVGTPRRVAGILAIVQLGLCAAAVVSASSGGDAVLWIAASAMVGGIAMITLLEARFDSSPADAHESHRHDPLPAPLTE